jgi:hypothetical protein
MKEDCPVRIPENSFMNYVIVTEQGAVENIWTKERWSNGRVEKTA